MTFDALETQERCVASDESTARICRVREVRLPDGTPSTTVWYELARSRWSGSGEVQTQLSTVAGGSSAPGPVRVFFQPLGNQKLNKLSLRIRTSGQEAFIRPPVERAAWHDLIPANQGLGGSANVRVTSPEGRITTMADDVYSAIPRQLRRSAIIRNGPPHLISEAVDAGLEGVRHQRLSPVSRSFQRGLLPGRGQTGACRGARSLAV